MKLRIVSGTLKGRYVIMPDAATAAAFRPTQERVRESVAEILKTRLRRQGCLAADVCAGSGAFGFEMLSRGASRVDFVESDAAIAAGIGVNAERLGAGGAARVLREDVRKFVDKAVLGGGYDVIFYDPPYGDAELAGLIPGLLELVNDGGVLVYERRRHPKEKKTADTAGKAGITDARVYSDTVVEIYCKDLKNGVQCRQPSTLARLTR